ncbi:MAG: aminotransferase class IV [Deltaproteobacteria bacterium]|nr:aminotransferase class IV [Deltaproteobacteria bacterium]
MKETFFIESIKLLDGVYHNLELHGRRMARTMEAFFGGRPGFELGEALPGRVPQKGLYKVRVVYGQRVQSVEVLPYVMRAVKSLEVVEAGGMDYSYKYLDRRAIDGLKAKSRADDIIIAVDGFVSDSSAANLVFEGEGGLFTPGRCLLAGVKRESLLAMGRIERADIRVGDLVKYKRVRLINAMIDLEDNVSVAREAIAMNGPW